MHCLPLLPFLFIAPQAPPATPAPLAPQDAPVTRDDFTAPNQTPSQPPDTSEKQKRVLHLESGRTVRGLTKFFSGTWLLRRNGKWIPACNEPVVSFRKESDLLRAARQLAREVPKKDSAGRTFYAGWLIRSGLIEEAKDELDAVLTLEPDAKPALQLIQAPAFPTPRTRGGVEAPEETAKTLIAAGARSGPVDRELLIKSLGILRDTEPSKATMRSALLKGLHSPSIHTRTFSAHALRRLLPGEEMWPLMQRCVMDVSGPVRREAALAVRAAKDPGLVIPILKALGSKSRGIRTNATESLGVIGHSTAVPALVKHFANLSRSGSGVMPTTGHIRIGSEFAYVQDFDLEIAQASSIADPVVRSANDVVQLEARVGGVSGYTYVTEFRTVYASLKQLTGANPGSSPADWTAWQEQQGRGPAGK